MLQTITFDALLYAINHTDASDEMKDVSEWHDVLYYLIANADALREIYNNSIDELIDHLEAEGFGIGLNWITNTYEELEELEEDMQ